MSAFTDNFLPRDFLDISNEIESSVHGQQDISRNQKDPAWLRAAISRAYYSAFLTLKQEFLGNTQFQNLIHHKAEDHGVIKEKLYTLPANLIYYANWFENLRVERNKADYDLPPRYLVNPSKVNVSNGQARNIIQNVSNIMSNIP